MRSRGTVSLILITALASVVEASPEKPNSRNRATELKTIDIALVNDATTVLGDQNAATLRAQILLDRANFSPGEIDGKTGVNLERAISAFQEFKGLSVSGKLDEPTWQALNADTSPAIVPYRITESDVAGPFTDIPQDLVQQSKLKALSYRSIEEALGEQFHSSPNLLRLLNPQSKYAAGEEIQVPNVLTAGAIPVKAAKIVVSKKGYVRAIDAEGRILAHYPSSSGSERDPLPIGEWKITGVSRKPIFNYNPALFWDASPGHTKAKIAAGPNNPVGPVWIDLNKEHYGIHGTPEPGKVGHTQSHGCIRLTNWDAMELAEMVAPNMQAQLTE